MKKLLISLTILFSLFLGVNSVSAEQGTSISPISYVSNYTYDTYLAKIQETGNFLYYNSYYDKKYYFGMGNNYYNSSNRSLFSVETDYPELISIGSKKHENRYEILLNIEYDENKPVYLYYSDGKNSSYSVNIIHADGTEEQLNNVTKSTGLLIKENTSLYLTGFVSPSYTSWEGGYYKVEVQDSYYVFTTNYDGIIYYKNINSNIQSAKTLNFSSTNTLINENMPLIYKFNWVTKDTEVDISPQIEMSLIEKQEDFTKVNINFSTFDREKYIYLYNFNKQPGLENWHEIINNDYIYKAIINGTLYVQVIDRAKFNETKEIETISAATYTFSDLLINEDIIDISTISKNSEIEYRYYGSTPAKFYVSTYRYGELPENVNCIVGTGIYECNIFNIMDIQSTYSFYSYAKNEVTGEDVYVKKYGYNDSPGYNSQIYEFYSKEDFTKYPITCVDNTSDCWSNNYYRSFTIDLTTYINSSSQYKGNYIYVYYNANIYDKSWNGSLNRNGTLEDFTEDNIKPPTYQESNSSFIQGFNDWFAPIIELINKRFPIIAQIGTILSSIFVNNHEDITNIEVDLSFLGMNQKYKLIDINAYKDVKDIIFFFEYCSILMIAIPKIIRNIKESFSD